MIAYCQEVRKLESKFDGFRFSRIPREQNHVVDELSKLGSSQPPTPPGVFVHVMDKPSVKFKELSTEGAPCTDAAIQEEVMIVYVDWRDPFVMYLWSGMLPTDKVQQQRLEVKARAYLLVDDELYRSGGTNILMKCIFATDGQDFCTRYTA